MKVLREVRVICTDRGQHRPYLFGVVKVVQDAAGRVGFVTDARGAGWLPPTDGRAVHQFRCQRCTRKPQLRPEHWTPIITRAAAAGLAELDISYANGF